MPTHNVFISHTTDESSIAKLLKDFIEEKFLKAISVFVSSDINDLTPGNKWLDKIDYELKECSVLLIICSPYSLTRPWINFEAGCGWVKQIEMIPICHSGQRKDLLPFPFSRYQGLQLEAEDFAYNLLFALSKHFNYDAPSISKRELNKLNKKIADAKRTMCVPDASPQVIQSSIERTQLINNDLQTLINSSNVSNETLWTVSLLSTFAVGKDHNLDDPEYLYLLLNERKLLIELAKRGCKIKCIISPVNPFHMISQAIDDVIMRTQNLLAFLKSKDKNLVSALSHIDFAVSEFSTKNLYIIGNMSCFEGYKTDPSQGYNLNLRQTSPDVIKANINVYEGFFNQLSARTLAKWGNENDNFITQREFLRVSVMRCLEESLKFLNDFQMNKVFITEDDDITEDMDVDNIPIESIENIKVPE